MIITDPLRFTICLFFQFIIRIREEEDVGDDIIHRRDSEPKAAAQKDEAL